MNNLTALLDVVNPVPAGWASIEPCPEITEAAEYDVWLEAHADELSEAAEMSGLVETYVRF